MRSAINARLVLSLGLLSFAGAGAAAAAARAEDAQEQARVLLSGESISRGGLEPGLAILPSTSATAIDVDAQEQGREMILGRPATTTPAARVQGHRSVAATGPGDRTAVVDAQESAREMILGSQSKATAAKTRLASKDG